MLLNNVVSVNDYQSAAMVLANELEAYLKDHCYLLFDDCHLIEDAPHTLLFINYFIRIPTVLWYN